MARKASSPSSPRRPPHSTPLKPRSSSTPTFHPPHPPRPTSGSAARLPPASSGTSPPAARPLLVNYYTRNTPYEHEARKLAESCRALNVELLSEPIDPRGSWEFNCAFKARFLKSVFSALGSSRPIVWVDADAIVRRTPDLFRGDLWDFAIHKHYGWMFASGTIYFGPTPAAAELLDRWLFLCDADPGQWDQVHLGSAWEDTAAARPLRTLWLPESYTRVFDFPIADPTATSP